jgi:hypothetical protein
MRPGLLLTSALLATVSAAASAQAPHAAHGSEKPAPSPSPATSDQALIANALSAAPRSLTAGATVMGHDGRVLRKGTSDWVCMPDMPDVPNDTPMCLDAPWRALIDAWMNKRPATVTQMGFGYMLQGDMPVSNVDPFATAPTPGNQWIQRGDPHVMVLVPDQKLLDGLSTDPKSGGPFVMWKGTPYAHIMVPATAAPKTP